MKLLWSRLKRIDLRMVFLAGICVAILHICSTLTASNFGRHPGFLALADKASLHKMTVLRPVSPDNQPIPFMSPNLRYAICRYDTSNGPVELNVTLPDETWSIALHTPDGANPFAATGQQQGTDVLKIRLVPSPDQFSGLSPEAEGKSDNKPVELTVVAKTGIAVVRAPVKGVAFQRMTEAMLLKAQCKSVATRS